MCFINRFIDILYRDIATFARASICNLFILRDRGYCFLGVFCLFFLAKVKTVKLVSVNEDFVSAMTLLGEENEPSIALKQTLERLV